MKLSEAMVLGDVLRERNPSVWIAGDGSCGCALGGAALATGHSEKELITWIMARNCETTEWFQFLWPWLSTDNVRDISKMFSDVCRAQMTFEQLVDYVRSIEPECGTCCKFSCDCPKEIAEEPVPISERESVAI